MIFVDTGAWFASVVPSDKQYKKAMAWLKNNQEFLLTTDYVIDETLTLLRARGELTRSIVLGEAFFSGKLTQIYYLTEDDIRSTWEIFSRFADKEWSFTDCSSKIVMEKLGIVKAFAFDHHFSQFGAVQVVP
ncbi:type II toxin-antitoxin system VapC family toxin [Cyanobacterium sp. Dongsha4]|uniref:type II toxin-antitoxin system VapC family toxin n=1 Tax=Cyanobacterium sp. DS4 TaxID=2878255 RepID=UPI002E8088D6|nr:PIN domain-containing protein [Cyanobacterium sp. Dongsha4]WVL00610.1 PIN domain-containing protein [Cyanobacterium sp. Dongsha4]